MISDAARWVNLPARIRWSVIGAVALCLALAVVALVSQLFSEEEGKADYILVALSAVQFTLSGMVVALVVFFSEREENFSSLQKRTDAFLTSQLNEVLTGVSGEDGEAGNAEVLCDGRCYICGVFYSIKTKEGFWRLWIGLNVDRITCVYVLLKQGHTEADLRRVFAHTFQCAALVGYTLIIEEAVRAGEAVFLLTLVAKDEKGILSQPERRLFWAQDIALMTQSFLRTAQRASLKPPLEARPSPH
jgi:hypothetical protein